MYPRTNYEMTEADLATLLSAMQPVPVMMIGGTAPSSQQENANRAWAALGTKMGFDSMTVQPIPGKGDRFFSAVPSETDIQRAERMTREAEEKRLRELAEVDKQIQALHAKRAALTGEVPQ
jgi:hypothetical protein